MKIYSGANIRNVAILGHSGCGKTTLVESILYNLGINQRMGSVEDKNTTSDYTSEEKERGISISASLIPVEYGKNKLNILDTPGYFDFVGETFGAIRACEASVIVLDASNGIEVGTEKAWTYTEKRQTPRIIFVNKMDKENVNYVGVIRNLKEKFGNKIAPFVLPIGTEDDFKGFVNVVKMIARVYDGKKCVDAPIPEDLMPKVQPLRDILIDSVAESNEEFMEKYFAGETFTDEEIEKGLRQGILQGDVIPVIMGSANKGIGIHTLLDMIVSYMPSPVDRHGGEHEGHLPHATDVVIRKVDEKQPFSGIVFKNIIDPYVGKISLVKVLSGVLKKEDRILNSTKNQEEKIGILMTLRGKEQLEIEKAVAGDIVAVAKVESLHAGDTICSIDDPIEYKTIKFPQPGLFKAIAPKSKSDEEKIGLSLQRLNEEDPSFSINRNRETKQLVLGGQGTIQLSVILNKLKKNFDVDVDIIPQRIAYRETITGVVTVQGKHKKQSGGAGQYGDVHIKFEPSVEGFVFEEKIFGGAVPKNYIPAVEKGLLESLEEGPIAGYPVVNIKATLLDGSYHAVDSNELAFKIAASLAFKNGLPLAKPVLLEPIMHLQITVPDEYMGDILGDITKRRGRILGMEPDEEGYQRILAEAPESELFTYSSDLRSMTQARGYFSVRFERYEEVPSILAAKIIAESKKE